MGLNSLFRSVREFHGFSGIWMFLEEQLAWQRSQWRHSHNECRGSGEVRHVQSNGFKYCWQWKYLCWSAQRHAPVHESTQDNSDHSEARLVDGRVQYYLLQNAWTFCDTSKIPGRVAANWLHNIGWKAFWEFSKSELTLPEWHKSIEFANSLTSQFFLSQAKEIDVYGAFLQNYSRAVDTVRKCSQSNNDFADITRSIRLRSLNKSQQGQAVSLETLLYSPVSRLQKNVEIIQVRQ